MIISKFDNGNSNSSMSDGVNDDDEHTLAMLYAQVTLHARVALADVTLLLHITHRCALLLHQAEVYDGPTKFDEDLCPGKLQGGEDSHVDANGAAQ